jgi:hypothetical protein
VEFVSLSLSLSHTHTQPYEKHANIYIRFEKEYRRRAYRVLMGKSEANGPLGSPRHRREDNINKVDIPKIGFGRGLIWYCSR